MKITIKFTIQIFLYIQCALKEKTFVSIPVYKDEININNLPFSGLFTKLLNVFSA